MLTFSSAVKCGWFASTSAMTLLTGHSWNACAFNMPRLYIARGEIEPPPVSGTECHLAVPDHRHLRSPAVEDPEANIVVDPADTVSGADLHVLDPAGTGWKRR